MHTIYLTLSIQYKLRYPEDDIADTEDIKVNERKNGHTWSIVLVTILAIILALIIAGVLMMKLFPDSIGTYFLLDLIEKVQEKLAQT